MKRRRAAGLLRWTVILSAVGGAIAIISLLVSWVARPKLTVTQVVDGPVVSAFYATGTLEAEQEYDIKSPVAGIVDHIWVNKGDKIKAGTKLATMKDDTAQVKRDQIDAEQDYNLKKTWADEKQSPLLMDFADRKVKLQERLDLAQNELERYQTAKEAVSPNELRLANDLVLQLKSDVRSIEHQRDQKLQELARDRDVAKEKLDDANSRLSHDVSSPIDGTVLDRPTSQGTRVEINGHLMQVADVVPSHLVMRAQVDEEDKAFLEEGQKVRMTLYAFTDRVFTGHVGRIYPKADTSRRTFEVDVHVETADATDAFSAGMTGELVFIIAEKLTARVIPSQAVQAGQVWIVREGRLQQADVQLGLRSIERTEVLKGLESSDQVVISPIGKARAGDRVRIDPMDPKTAAGLNKPKESNSSMSTFKG